MRNQDSLPLTLWNNTDHGRPSLFRLLGEDPPGTSPPNHRGPLELVRPAILHPPPRQNIADTRENITFRRTTYMVGKKPCLGISARKKIQIPKVMHPVYF